jgi:hypothetical protein
VLSSWVILKKLKQDTVNKQVLGIVLVRDDSESISEFKSFLRAFRGTLGRAVHNNGTRLLKVTIPAPADRMCNNAALGAIRSNPMVRWAGELRDTRIETGQLTVELRSFEAAASLRNELPPSIYWVEQFGHYLVLTVQPQIGRGIHKLSAELKKNPAVRHVNVNVYPGVYIKHSLNKLKYVQAGV